MTKPIPELTDKQKRNFWRKVDVRGPDECWPWIAGIFRHGYGKFKLKSGNFGAHRISLALDGRDPCELVARHTCDNPPCCNPSHLLSGTVADNVRDMVERGRMAKGVNRGGTKFSLLDIPIIRADIRSHRTIAADYGVRHAVIGKIKRRELWAHVD